MNPVRVQLKRKKGWRLPPNTVVVARPTKWGNPFKIGKTYGAVHGLPKVGLIRTIEDAVLVYMDYRELHPLTESEVSELRGKNLACWCSLNRACHADVLLQMVNQ